MQCGRPGFDPWVGKILWGRERLPTPAFWPGEFHRLYIVHGVTKSRTWLSDWSELNVRTWKEIKKRLDECERGEWKSWLKTQLQKTRIMTSNHIASWQIDGETMEATTDFLLLGSKITADGDGSHEMKRRLLVGRKLWQT